METTVYHRPGTRIVVLSDAVLEMILPGRVKESEEHLAGDPTYAAAYLGYLLEAFIEYHHGR